MNCIIADLKQTEKLGSILAELTSPGDILALEGELGTGKTTLTQAIALGLGITNQYITSPSFAILHEYQGRLPLYHFDFYRLGDSTEVEEQGFSEYFYKDGLCVIEWAALAEEFLPSKRLTITLQHNKENNKSRNVIVEGSLYKNNFYPLLKEKLHNADIFYHK